MSNWIKLYPHQIDAVEKIKNGNIVYGQVGSGKSRTALAYYYICCGGDLRKQRTILKKPMDLYIITTARKRDTEEWEEELNALCMSSKESINGYSNKIIIDSWNNIKKYDWADNSFFIFDEQRVVGYGVWVKSFLKIAKKNQWILLSATPGDTWLDYIPVFIANGFYKNKREFEDRHIVYKRYLKYPVIDRYVGVGELQYNKKKVLRNVEFDRDVLIHRSSIPCKYDMDIYKFIMKERKNPYKDSEPINTAASLCYVLRQVVNKDNSRMEALKHLLKRHPRVIVFYNFNYELDILKSEKIPGYEISEWNGHKHEPIPKSDKWIYLVQYAAGAEGWNCITTDCILFYSLNYSYKMMEQAAGRINRLNSPYKELYLYTLVSEAKIDKAIKNALMNKRNFNESSFAKFRDTKGVEWRTKNGNLLKKNPLRTEGLN